MLPTCLAGQTVEQVGPYLAHTVEGGPALKKPLPQSIAAADSWTEWVWFHADNPGSDSLIAGIGAPDSPVFRYFALRNGRPGVRLSAQSSLFASATLAPGAWHMLAVTEGDNHATLYVDGAQAASGPAVHGKIEDEIQMAPDPAPGEADSPPSAMVRFSGDIGGFSAAAGVLPAAEIARMFAAPPDFEAQLREENAKPWAVQTKQQVGYRAPEDPEDMPHGAAPDQPHAKPLPPPGPTLHQNGNRAWEIAANWHLLSNTGATAIPAKSGAQVSLPGFNDSGWLAATVPGTVLTTMIDRGIYPDPDFGLNNLAIPESLNQHDYWYRAEFPTPATDGAGRRFTLHFAGVNYLAEVWLNGQRLGQIRGAFRRGDFDVTRVLRPNAANALAVRVAPPPHPGIPNEESLKGGPGFDGGLMTIDGPTFVATEGWDWIPAIRDRDTGLWQGVSLAETGPITLGDPQIVTRLPLPDTSSADVELHLPVHNSATAPVHVTVTAAFEGVQVRLPAMVPPGDTVLHLLPRNFAPLHLLHPRLWWPNGYGRPDLYHLKLRALTADDWHRKEGGDTHELMRQVDLQLGTSSSLAEFERRIQLFNYVDYQAIFEGLYSHLWAPNSGRMIWMTQPAWPSTMWQMYSCDYDTQASFYAIKKANAPLHVQMDLSDHTVAVVNTTRQSQKDLRITARIVSPSNETLDVENTTVNADANSATPALHLPISSLTQKTPLVPVRLEMRDAAGSLVADNFYWVARDGESYRGLNNLPAASIETQLVTGPPVHEFSGEENTWSVRLKNTGTAPALTLKLTLLRPDQTRVLPAYYSDNYVSLLPGEARTVVVHAPVASVESESVHFTLRGWNFSDRSLQAGVGIATSVGQ